MITNRFVRFLNKDENIIDQIQYPCPEEWNDDQVKEDIEKDVKFVKVLEVSHDPIPGLYGKI